MKKFLHINRGKWGFIFKRLLIGSAIIWTSLFFLPLSDKPAVPFLLLLFLTLSAGLAAILLLLIITWGYFSFQRQEQLFTKEPLSIFFDKYRFHTELINTHNRWRLTQEIKMGWLQTYPIVIFNTPGKSQFINMVIIIEWTQKEELLFAELKSRFKEYHIVLGRGGVLKTMRCFGDIEEQIRSLLELVKDNRLRPGMRSLQ